jgi:hypothetical protein
MRTGGTLGGKRSALLDLIQRTDQRSRSTENKGRSHANRTRGKCAGSDESGVDGAVGIEGGGLVGLPLGFLRFPAHTGRGTVGDRVTRRVGCECGFACVLIDGLRTGRIGGRGQWNTTAHRANNGTHDGEGTERGGLEDSGLVIRFK